MSKPAVAPQQVKHTAKDAVSSKETPSAATAQEKQKQSSESLRQLRALADKLRADIESARSAPLNQYGLRDWVGNSWHESTLQDQIKAMSDILESTLLKIAYLESEIPLAKTEPVKQKQSRETESQLTEKANRLAADIEQHRLNWVPTLSMGGATEGHSERAKRQNEENQAEINNLSQQLRGVLSQIREVRTTKAQAGAESEAEKSGGKAENPSSNSGNRTPPADDPSPHRQIVGKVKKVNDKAIREILDAENVPDRVDALGQVRDETMDYILGPLQRDIQKQINHPGAAVPATKNQNSGYGGSRAPVPSRTAPRGPGPALSESESSGRVDLVPVKSFPAQAPQSTLNEHSARPTPKSFRWWRDIFPDDSGGAVPNTSPAPAPPPKDLFNNGSSK